VSETRRYGHTYAIINLLINFTYQYSSLYTLYMYLFHGIRYIHCRGSRYVRCDPMFILALFLSPTGIERYVRILESNVLGC
jgi:hypothetical protein